MDVKNVWDVVRDERLALIADLEPLRDEQWDTPSLCGDWTVHDVAAHVVDTAKASKTRFVRDMVVARGNFDRQNQTGVERERSGTPSQMLDRLRATVDLRRTPPAPLDSRLVEVIVHGEDIRRPLGLTREYPTAAVVDSFRLQAKTSKSLGGSKELLAGLSLSAVDADLVRGDGPKVEGTALALLLAACGRAVSLDELNGPGLTILRERLDP